MSLPARPKITAPIALGCGLACFTILLLSWLTGAVLQGGTTRFDRYIRGAVHSAASPALTSIMLFFTDLGSNLGLAILFLTAMFVFWKLRWRAAALSTLIAMAGAVAWENILKAEVHRQRPLPFFSLAVPHSYSYPSGHALLSCAFFSMMAWLASSRISRPSLRVAIWLAATGIILNIGFSRIYLGVHYPTDVIAGYLTGIAWVTAVILGTRVYIDRRQRDGATRVVS